MGRYFRFESFCEGFMFAKLRHMRSFEKIESLRDGEITRLLTGIGKSCSSRDFYPSKKSHIKLFYVH